MTEVEARARDPLRTYHFRVQVGGVYVAGVQKVSGLNMKVEASEVREGGNSLHRYANPDRATWDPITLEQGLALDTTLEKWAEAVIHFLKAGSVQPDNQVKRDVFIDLWEPLPGLRREAVVNRGNDERGRVRSYHVFNAWISRYQAIPALDGMSNEVALLNVELMHEGWDIVLGRTMPFQGQRSNGSSTTAEG